MFITMKKRLIGQPGRGKGCYQHVFIANGDIVLKNVSTAAKFTFLIAGLGVLAACAGSGSGGGLYSLPGPRAVEFPLDSGLIVFASEQVGKTPVKRIQYTDNEQRIDYALFKCNGAQGEFIFMDTPYTLNVSFNFPFNIRDKVEAWNFSKGQAAEWETAVQIHTKLGFIFYRYRLTGLIRACFGISGEWDIAPGDPKLHYTRIMFGYYYQLPGIALEDEKMRTLIDNIGLKGVTQRDVRFSDNVLNFHRDVAENFSGPQAGSRAMSMAQGGGLGASAGIGEFPFNYAEYYNLGDSEDKLD